MYVVLLVSVVINHAAPTVCMNVPISEAKSAISKLRNKGIRRGCHALRGDFAAAPAVAGAAAGRLLSSGITLRLYINARRPAQSRNAGLLIAVRKSRWISKP